MAVPAGMNPCRSRLEDTVELTESWFVQLLYLERKNKATSRWKFKETGLVSSGPFCLKALASSHFLLVWWRQRTEASEPGCLAQLEGMKPWILREKDILLTWIPHQNLLLVCSQHDGLSLACIRSAESMCQLLSGTTVACFEGGCWLRWGPSNRPLCPFPGPHSCRILTLFSSATSSSCLLSLIAETWLHSTHLSPQLLLSLPQLIASVFNKAGLLPFICLAIGSWFLLLNVFPYPWPMLGFWYEASSEETCVLSGCSLAGGGTLPTLRSSSLESIIHDSFLLSSAASCLPWCE